MTHQYMKSHRMKLDYKTKNEFIDIYTKNINKIISSGNLEYNSLLKKLIKFINCYGETQ